MTPRSLAAQQNKKAITLRWMMALWSIEVLSF
jgi:hypothetical protein